MQLYRRFVKRAIDIFVSGIALVMVSPVLATVTVWLHFANKGAGAFFLQERPGLRGKIFRIIKFKTMTDGRTESGRLLPDAERLTRVGRFVRATSIDELPQLINVFKGDMSLIGPRPLLTWFLPLYNAEQSRRHQVRPGITGWAQVHGRNCITYTQKFNLDVWYVDHVSFRTDITILIKTIKNVFGAKDIGNGIDDAEVDDLGWYLKQDEAERIFERDYRK